jgi:hypothetical protein
MAVSDQLQTGVSTYAVQGRQGWLIDQHLSFGPYQSGKVKRGWTKAYDIPFILRFTGAKERLQFELAGQEGGTAEVFCLGKLRETDLTWFKEYFEINLRTKDLFSGTVVLNEHDSYTFVVENLNQNNHFREAAGYVHGPKMQLTMQSVSRLEGDKAWLGQQVPGFEFVHDGRVIGAVETLDNGRVWIRNNLPEDQRLLTAALSAALLLRSELEGKAEL